MKKSVLLTILASTSIAIPSMAQQDGITDTRNSKFAVVNSTPVNAVKWVGGFWGERFNVFSGTSLYSMWDTWKSDKGHGYNNLLIAAGEKQGKRHGPPFHDGDMYKWLEAMAAAYAINKDPELDKIMDDVIRLIAKAQQPDGYLHTPVVIAQMNKKALQGEEKENENIGTAVGSSKDGRFGNPLNFEAYNMGHLITAGIIHHRATGKTNLFDCALKAADCLYDFYMHPSGDALEKGVICPSQYMAITEIYRETGNPKYLELAKQMVNMRDSVKNGTDDNQDRIPFRKQYNAMGHSVRANYLYAGVADLYIEDGEAQLKKNLDAIWNDIVYRKMYINGACGALYDGTSPDGTEYNPALIQKVHQSYGRPYQLPQSTAHNETCANIGNMMLNWRLFQATADAKYTDIVENSLFNSILCGISLDGKKYFYTNPLRMSDKLPYTLRWPRERVEYISCFCCPPNTLRTLCEAQDYAYSVGENEIYVNLYGANTLATKIEGIGEIGIEQKTDYPWNGNVTINVNKLKGKKDFTLKLRIPSWCSNAKISVNGETVNTDAKSGSYASITREWKKGDTVVLDMPMETRLVEANPLVEECRGQVAVQRGPILYCVESNDLDGVSIDDIAIPADAKFTPVETNIDGCKMIALETEATNRNEASWENTLYREISKNKKNVKIRLIPYYAWGNRGKSEMTVWIPVEL